MKKLILIRHAQVDQGQGFTDMTRPLDPQGQVDAENLGEFLKSHHIYPNLILVSPAQRTQMTAQIITKTLQFPAERCIIEPRIYDNVMELLLQVIVEQPVTVNTLILVGHNPGMTSLAVYLTGDSQLQLCTGSACCLALSSSWQEVQLESAKCEWLEHC